VRQLVLKLHIYAGLLTFAQLVVYGIAGLAATVEERPRPKIVQSSRELAYTVPASKTDKEVADDIYRTLALPLTRPMPLFAITRDARNDLRLDFYNINGIHRVTVLEREHRLRIDEVHNGPATFVNDLHTVTLNDDEAPRLVRVWGYYNAFAMWCLLGFCVSGVHLWLTATTRSLWAWGCLSVGSAVFAALWIAFR
jgi:uncharacterized iron-regulated membrane protein